MVLIRITMVYTTCSRSSSSSSTGSRSSSSSCSSRRSSSGSSSRSSSNHQVPTVPSFTLYSSRIGRTWQPQTKLAQPSPAQALRGAKVVKVIEQVATEGGTPPPRDNFRIVLAKIWLGRLVSSRETS